MKTFFCFILCVVAGCAATSVSKDPVQSLILGEWELNANAYIVEYDDSEFGPSIVPCVRENHHFLPKGDWVYDEGAVGRDDGGKRIVGVIRQGAILKVIDVMKDSHPTMGITYHPIVIFVDNSSKKVRKLDGDLIYRNYEKKGVFNPEWVRRYVGAEKGSS